jgi:hypothetical protein
MNQIISVLVGFASGLGTEWFATYVLYRNQSLPLGGAGLVVRFVMLLVSLVLLAFVFDWLLSNISGDAAERNELGRIVLLTFSAGIAFRILLRRFK